MSNLAPRAPQFVAVVTPFAHLSALSLPLPLSSPLSLGAEAPGPEGQGQGQYRGTSLTRNTPLLGPYSSPMLRDLW